MALDPAAADEAAHRLAEQLAQPPQPDSTPHAVWWLCVETVHQLADRYPPDSYEWQILRQAYVALLRHEPPEPEWQPIVEDADRQVVTARQAAAAHQLNGPMVAVLDEMRAERYRPAPPRQRRRAA